MDRWSPGQAARRTDAIDGREDVPALDLTACGSGAAREHRIHNHLGGAGAPHTR